MRSSAFLLLFFFMHFAAAAQKARQSVYFYTLSSEQYLKDAEIDSLLYSSSAKLFQENLVPSSLFEQHYPTVKTALVALSKNGIVQAFKTIEYKQKGKAAAQKGSQQFADNKQLYIAALQKQVKAAFQTNKLLSKYLLFTASDRITSFNSTVRVNRDGSLLVEENISVYNGNGQANPVYGNEPLLKEAGAVNNEIKRGIVRSFPLYYINEYKLFQNTTFELKEVLRDGKKEDHHTEKYKNGILIYTGSRNVILTPGNYNYSIKYETAKQLKSLKDFDELYWNVTGNSWSFRIDSATCTVILPKGATVLSSKCYTGLQGAASEDCNITGSTAGDSSIIILKTTKPLLPKQGISIAVSWPKGFINNPSAWQQLKYYAWNNEAVFFLPIAALLSAIICFIFWLRYGRDPGKGTIYPLFEPPAGFSPAAMGFIYRQKFSRQLTAATIVDAAVRNKIKIDVEREGWLLKHNEYVISKSSGRAKPPVSDYEDFESDVENLIDSSIEKGKYNSQLGNLNSSVQKYCESNYKNKDGWIRKNYKGFFALNTSYTTLPAIICLVAGVWGFVGGLVKAIKLGNYWQLAYFVGGIILCVIVLKIFARLLTAYSPAGRKLADTIEGFRMFLSTADEKRFDMMAPPVKSLELYEKYLPFAIALGCEVEWGKKFEEIIDTAYLDGKAATSFSRSFTRDNDSMGSSFTSSFTGAISSASSPPSSSSGGGSSFGGGSSGGGGGGGGGGGW